MGISQYPLIEIKTRAEWREEEYPVRINVYQEIVRRNLLNEIVFTIDIGKGLLHPGLAVPDSVNAF